MYLGRALNHAADNHQFLNIATELVLISRDVIWLNKVYGDYTGSKEEARWDVVTMIPKPEKAIRKPQFEAMEDDRQGKEQQEDAIEDVRDNPRVEPGIERRRQGQEQQKPERPKTRSQGHDESVDTSQVKRNFMELKRLGIEVDRPALAERV